MRSPGLRLADARARVPELEVFDHDHGCRSGLARTSGGRLRPLHAHCGARSARRAASSTSPAARTCSMARPGLRTISASGWTRLGMDVRHAFAGNARCRAGAGAVSGLHRADETRQRRSPRAASGGAPARGRRAKPRSSAPGSRPWAMSRAGRWRRSRRASGPRPRPRCARLTGRGRAARSRRDAPAARACRRTALRRTDRAHRASRSTSSASSSVEACERVLDAQARRAAVRGAPSSAPTACATSARRDQPADARSARC